MKKVLFVNNYGMDDVGFAQSLNVSLARFGLRGAEVKCVETVDEGLAVLEMERDRLGVVVTNTFGGYSEPERLVSEFRARGYDALIMILSRTRDTWVQRNPQFIDDDSVICVGRGFCRIVFDVLSGVELRNRDGGFSSGFSACGAKPEPK